MSTVASKNSYVEESVGAGGEGGLKRRVVSVQGCTVFQDGVYARVGLPRGWCLVRGIVCLGCLDRG